MNNDDRSSAVAPAVTPFRGVQASGESVFSQAWHAQALAVADGMIRAGLITATQWSEALGAALQRRAAAQACETADDDETAYYAAVIEALETLAGSLEGIGGKSLDERTQAWRTAYLNTPHGHPVEL